MLKSAICAAAFAATVAAPMAQRANNVELSMKREYGRAIYRDCRLDVTIFEQNGRAAWQCTSNTDPVKVLRAERALAPREMIELSSLTGESDLCSGGHTGRDGRSVDGVLETLMSKCPEARVAVLVTSDNPTFTANDARRRLLQRMHALEAELRGSALRK